MLSRTTDLRLKYRKKISLTCRFGAVQINQILKQCKMVIDFVASNYDFINIRHVLMVTLYNKVH